MSQLSLAPERSAAAGLEERQAARAWTSLKFFVAGVLLAGSAAGFWLNPATRGHAVIPSDGPAVLSEAEQDAVSAVPEPLALPGVRPATFAGLGKLARISRSVAPQDPFEPTEADPASSPAALLGGGTPWPGEQYSPDSGSRGPVPILPDVRVGVPVAVVPRAPASPSAKPAPKPAARPAAKPAARPAAKPTTPGQSGPERPILTGVVQGDPPVAVVRWGGQTMFLRVGDQVAGLWRLEQVKENSAVFRLGEQRVETHIQGGSE
ncbi:MAG: hypothetical protein FJX77_01385 [Armatimonadetes bacterium]|nr:hypothetical protein [Armatimonadota bacterium]